MFYFCGATLLCYMMCVAVLHGELARQLELLSFGPLGINPISTIPLYICDLKKGILKNTSLQLKLCVQFKCRA